MYAPGWIAIAGIASSIDNDIQLNSSSSEMALAWTNERPESKRVVHSIETPAKETAASTSANCYWLLRAFLLSAALFC